MEADQIINETKGIKRTPNLEMKQKGTITAISTDINGN